MRVEVAYGKVLHLVEQIPAHCVQYTVGYLDHEPAVKERGEDADGIDNDEKKDGPYKRGQVFGGRRLADQRHDAVIQKRLDHIRTGDTCAGAYEDKDQDGDESCLIAGDVFCES